MEASNFQEESTQLNSQISIIKEHLEVKYQQIYDHKNNIALKAVLLEEYQQEIEISKSKNNLIEVNSQQKIKKVQDSISNLQIVNNAKLMNQCDEEEYLIKEIQECKRDTTKKEDNLENEFINIEKQRHEQLKNEIIQTKRKILDMQKNIEDLNFENNKLKETNQTLNSDLNAKTEYLNTKKFEYKNIQKSIQKLQEDISETQLELDSLKCKPLDPSQKGNSMFAEVEDSRTKLQQKLQHIKKLYTSLQHDVFMKLKYMKLACKKNFELCHELNPTQDSKDDYLEEQLADILSQIPTLESDLEEYKEKLNEQMNFNVEDLPSCIATFANNTINELCNNAIKMGDQVNAISKNTIKIINQIKIATRETLEWKQKNFKLKVEISNWQCAELEKQFQPSSTDVAGLKINTKLENDKKIADELICKSEIMPLKVKNENVVNITEKVKEIKTENVQHNSTNDSEIVKTEINNEDCDNTNENTEKVDAKHQCLNKLEISNSNNIVDLSEHNNKENVVRKYSNIPVIIKKI